MPSKTIQQWQQVIKDQVAASTVLAAAFTNTSAFAIWNLLTYIAAVAAFSVDALFDSLKATVNATLAAQKPHTLKWYATKATAFQLGYNLVPDQDYYDNTGISEADIAASKIVAYAAVSEVPKGLSIKVARLLNGDLAPLVETGSQPQLQPFTEYMHRIKDAGIYLYYTNAQADRLTLDLDIYYNALLLDKDGKRLDGTNDTPVQDAIVAFLQNQPFNGLFVLSMLVDALQKVEGVVIPHIVSAQAAYGALPLADIAVEYLPNAGYLRINTGSADLHIDFLPHQPI